tara:strand:+ start:183 stop:470 length:288 start_codon:yes stop_codon:yes gene_type:complete
MYYRINRVSFDSDKFDEIMTAIEGKRELFENFEGLQNSRIVRVSETEAITIAEYDSEENLENSKTEFAEMMKEMASMFNGVETSYGERVWHFSKD